MSDHSHRIRAALERKADTEKPQPASSPADTTTSSISVSISAEALRFLLSPEEIEALHGEEPKPVDVSGQSSNPRADSAPNAEPEEAEPEARPETHAAPVESMLPLLSAGDRVRIEPAAAPEPTVAEPQTEDVVHAEESVPRAVQTGSLAPSDPALSDLAASDLATSALARSSGPAAAPAPTPAPAPPGDSKAWSRPPAKPVEPIADSQIPSRSPKPAPALGPFRESASSEPFILQPAKATGRKTLILAAAAAGVALLLGAGFYFFRGGASTPGGAAATPMLALAAEPGGSGQVNLRWNPGSPAISKAQSGQLVVKEGSLPPRTVSLSQLELKSGHLLYQSPEEHLEFRLEVADRSGTTAAETVTVIAPRPAETGAVSQVPAAPVASVPAPASSGKTQPVQDAQAAPAAPPVNPAPAAQEQPQTAPKPTPKAFTLPAAKAPAVPASRVIIDSPGAVAASAAVNLPGASSLPNLPSAAPPPPAEPKPRTGGELQPAALIRKVTPQYPALARAARIQGTVRFSATIGKDGKLQNIHLLSGPASLVQAATDAIKQWVYRPPMLNGEPVEVSTQVEVNFALP